MKSRVATIAHYTLLEGWRTRLPAIVLAVLALTACASFFVEQLAITEGTRFRAGFYAAAARWATVLIVSLHVLAAIARELDDKVLDVLLALDLPRSCYVLGRLAGFTALAALIAVAACLPLAWSVPATALLQWGVSLAFELAIVAALALFCAITFSQIVPAAGFVAGFYVLRGRRRRRVGEVQIPRLASFARDDTGTPVRDDSEALPRGGSADRSHTD